LPDCSRLVALLTEYLDGRLPEELRSSLDRHLGECPECVTFLRTFQSTLSLVKSLEERDLPPELRLKLRAFLDERAKS
jgi:anti-sigma factor RsiW